MRGVRDMLSTVPGTVQSPGGVAPPWLSTTSAADNSVGGRLMYVIGLGVDVLIEKAQEASAAHMPGTGTDTALPELSLDRLISQGPSETAAAFALRLAGWLDAWWIAGSPRSAMQQLRGYFSPFAPLVRTVDRTSNWFSFTASEDPATGSPSMRHGAANWIWDTIPSLAQPDHDYGWWNIWVIIQSVSPQAWCSKAPAWGSGTKWGKANNMSWGFAQPSGLFQGIRERLWKPAHAWCRWIIVSFDATLFDPAQASGGVNPDGTWGDWGKVVSGTFVASRNASARYIDGVTL